ncbi:MAG: hypothetical protein R3C53_18080 [Pirellulaceae bacterium]
MHDRYRDIPDELRAEVSEALVALDAPAHYLELVQEGGQLANEEAAQILGESLPLGLRLDPLRG